MQSLGPAFANDPLTAAGRQHGYAHRVRFFKWLNRLAGRFDRWIGSTVAAESVLHEGGLGGAKVDPLGLDLLNLQLHQDESEDSPR
jgi:hypothetical protein